MQEKSSLLKLHKVVLTNDGDFAALGMLFFLTREPPIGQGCLWLSAEGYAF